MLISYTQKTERHISFGETVVSAGSTSSDSDSSLSDTCPLEDGPALIEIKKDAILQLLPNFTPANVSIMARYVFNDFGNHFQSFRDTPESSMIKFVSISSVGVCGFESFRILEVIFILSISLP